MFGVFCRRSIGFDVLLTLSKSETVLLDVNVLASGPCHRPHCKLQKQPKELDPAPGRYQDCAALGCRLQGCALQTAVSQLTLGKEEVESVGRSWVPSQVDSKIA